MYDYNELSGNCNCPSGSFSYTIKSGDTLYLLAKRYNTTVEAIKKLNPGINPNNLQIGQKICIPGSTTPTPPPPPTRCPSGSFAYTIKSGDTLYLLAIRYNTTVEAIMRLNPGIDPMNLQIGQVICIPSSTPPPTRCPSGTFEYTIKAGDTLFELANRFNTTVQAIMAVNPGIDPNNLRVGQVICIPEVTPPPTRCPSGTFEYTIRAGDTLFELANRFNTTVQAIMAVNPGIDPSNLRVGQVICIPEVTPPPMRCPMGTFEYTIRAGDTLFELAMRFNTTVQAIMAVNPGIDPSNLRVGQVICIPEVTPPPTRCPMGTFEYTIRAGDTLFGLANRFNTTVQAIMAVNPGIDPNNLRVGQIICIPEVTPPPMRCPMGTFEYTIRAGDTLFGLANRFNTTAQAIMAVNPGIDPNNLRVGQIICIPEVTPPPTRCPSGSFEYTVRAGDTLYELAKRFNTTVEAIMSINMGLDPCNLKIGQVICIPKAMPPECDGMYYVVRAGDTLYSIANMFNVSLADLMAANPGVDPNNLRVGQMLCIPKPKC